MLTDSEYYWRRLYASALVVASFGSGVAGLYLQPLAMGLVVYLAVARRRFVLVDAGLLAAATALLFVSAKYIGPAPFSDWSAMIPAFDASDLMSWMFMALIAAKILFFAGSAGVAVSDFRHVNLRSLG